MARFNRRDFLTGSALGLATTTACRPAQTESPAAGKSTDRDALGPDPWIELDAAALRHNLEAIRKQVGKRPVMPVIKCNAYGHGLAELADMLLALSVSHVAVAKTDAALALRQRSKSAHIVSFGPFGDRDASDIVAAQIEQSVYDDRVEILAARARSERRTAPVQVNVDTGLGRVGVHHGRAAEYLSEIAALEGVRIAGVFTALTEDPEFDAEQLKRFANVCDAAAKRGVEIGTRHAASSAAVMSQPDALLDLVRPGISIYGHYPSDSTWKSRPIDLKPVLSLKARTVQVKTLAPGESLSYHRSFVAERPTRVATLPVGYSDGYPSKLAGRGDVLIRGRYHPVIAMVTANHTLVNVDGDERVAVGDEATLIGRQDGGVLDGHVVADAAGFSVYKLLIGMSPSLPRVVVNDSTAG